MKKRVCLMLLTGAILMGLAGCAKEEPGRYALIVNNTTVETQEVTDAVWEGMQSYALLKEVGCQKYTANGTERKDYAEAIEEAVDNGARIVVCIGEDLEVPVYEAQKDFRRVNFILLDGEPHKRYSRKTNMDENTIALYFNETQQGFLAGYMAVINGYRNIACMGGAETEENLKVTSGFIQGAEMAAVDLGLAEGDVQLCYTFTGEDKLSPVYMSRALDWYKDGCEVVFALEEGVRRSVTSAAKIQSGWLLATKENALEESDRIVTSAIIDYAAAVANQIELIETKEFVGNQVLNCGVKEKGVSLIVENIGLSDNTVAQYNAMCRKLSEGTLKIEETVTIPSVNIATVIRE